MKKKQIWLLLLLLLTVFFGCKKDDEAEDKQKETAVEVQSGVVKLGNITIEVPEGALSSSISMTAKPLPIDSYEDCVAAVDFGPEGTEFLKPITVTMPLERVPADGVVVAFYQNKEENKLEAVDVAEVSGNMATFHVNHFSAYLLISLTQGDFEAMTQGVRKDVKAGQDINYVATKYFDYLVKTDNYYNRWTMIGGRLYKPSFLLMSMMYSYDRNFHQAVFSVGDCRFDHLSITQNETKSDYMFSFDSSDLIYVVDSTGKTKVELCKEFNEIYNISVNREYILVDPQLEYEEKGKLEKKGDECELTIHLFSEHTGETYYPSFRWCVDEAFEEKTTIELVDEYPTQKGKMPWIYQEIKLKSTDPSLELSQTTVTTDENGEAKVKVKATKDQVKGQIEIEYDYHDEFDATHVEKTVSFENGALWDLTLNCEVKMHNPVGLDVMYTYTLNMVFPDQEIISSQCDAHFSLDHPVMYTPKLEFSKIDSDGFEEYQHYVFSVSGEAFMDTKLIVLTDKNNKEYVTINGQLFSSWQQLLWESISNVGYNNKEKCYLPMVMEAYLKLSEGTVELPVVESFSKSTSESKATKDLMEGTSFSNLKDLLSTEPAQYKCTATLKKINNN